MVDTNDGERGKTISAFHMGLEAIGINEIPSSQYEIIQKGALMTSSPRVIKELALDTPNGILTIDDARDNLWYHFIQGDHYRGDADARYADVDIEGLITSLFKLKSEYEESIGELKKIVGAKRESERNVEKIKETLYHAYRRSGKTVDMCVELITSSDETHNI